MFRHCRAVCASHVLFPDHHSGRRSHNRRGSAAALLPLQKFSSANRQTTDGGASAAFEISDPGARLHQGDQGPQCRVKFRTGICTLRQSTGRTGSGGIYHRAASTACIGEFRHSDRHRRTGRICFCRDSFRHDHSYCCALRGRPLPVDAFDFAGSLQSGADSPEQRDLRPALERSGKTAGPGEQTGGSAARVCA